MTNADAALAAVEQELVGLLDRVRAIRAVLAERDPAEPDLETPPLLAVVLNEVGRSWSSGRVLTSSLRHHAAPDLGELSAAEFRKQLVGLLGNALPKPERHRGNDSAYNAVDLFVLVNDWYFDRGLPVPWEQWRSWAGMLTWLDLLPCIDAAARSIDVTANANEVLKAVRGRGGVVGEDMRSAVIKGVRAVGNDMWRWVPTVLKTAA